MQRSTRYSSGGVVAGIYCNERRSFYAFQVEIYFQYAMQLTF